MISTRWAAKSVELLRRRLVLQAARYELEPNAFKAWLAHAMALQQSVYEIDDYFECSAQIELDVEMPMWRALELVLRRGGTASPESEVWASCHALRSYAAVERRLHALDPIDVRDFPTVLALKCSDVRMARALIPSYSNRPWSSAELAFWRAYDECAELIEDVQDIHEDGADWNFNFWLYSFMAGHSAENGIVASEALLRKRLVDLQVAFCRVTASSPLLAHGLAVALAAGENALRDRARPIRALMDGSVSRYRELASQRLAG